MKLSKLSKTALCVAVPTAAAVPFVATSCKGIKADAERPNVIFILMDDAGGCKEDLDNRQTVPHTFLTAGFQS